MSHKNILKTIFKKNLAPAPKNMLKILKYHPKKYNLHPHPLYYKKAS